MIRRCPVDRSSPVHIRWRRRNRIWGLRRFDRVLRRPDCRPGSGAAVERLRAAADAQRQVEHDECETLDLIGSKLGKLLHGRRTDADAPAALCLCPSCQTQNCWNWNKVFGVKTWSREEGRWSDDSTQLRCRAFDRLRLLLSTHPTPNAIGNIISSRQYLAI